MGFEPGTSRFESKGSNNAAKQYTLNFGCCYSIYTLHTAYKVKCKLFVVKGLNRSQLHHSALV